MLSIATITGTGLQLPLLLLSHRDPGLRYQPVSPQQRYTASEIYFGNEQHIKFASFWNSFSQNLTSNRSDSVSNLTSNEPHSVCWWERVPTGDWSPLRREGLWTSGPFHLLSDMQHHRVCDMGPRSNQNVSGATSRKQPTLQQRATLRVEPETSGGQLLATGECFPYIKKCFL